MRFASSAHPTDCDPLLQAYRLLQERRPRRDWWIPVDPRSIAAGTPLLQEYQIVPERTAAAISLPV